MTKITIRGGLRINVKAALAVKANVREKCHVVCPQGLEGRGGGAGLVFVIGLTFDIVCVMAYLATSAVPIVYCPGRWWHWHGIMTNLVLAAKCSHWVTMIKT